MTDQGEASSSTSTSSDSENDDHEDRIRIYPVKGESTTSSTNSTPRLGRTTIDRHHLMFTISHPSPECEHNLTAVDDNVRHPHNKIIISKSTGGTPTRQRRQFLEVDHDHLCVDRKAMRTSDSLPNLSQVSIIICMYYYINFLILGNDIIGYQFLQSDGYISCFFFFPSDSR